MRRYRLLPVRVSAMVLTLSVQAVAQTPAPATAPPPDPPPAAAAAPAPAGTEKKKRTRADLEKDFREMLTGATLTGVWQMTGDKGLTGTEPLTPPKEERYTIASVTRLAEDYWLVSARIQIAQDKDVTVPVPVRVIWSGDTPVMTLDDVGVPMLGTYSARVMFYRDFYSGIWLSNEKNYGGVMAGRITREGTSAPAPKSDPESKPSTPQP